MLTLGTWLRPLVLGSSGVALVMVACGDSGGSTGHPVAGASGAAHSGASGVAASSSGGTKTGGAGTPGGGSSSAGASDNAGSANAGSNAGGALAQGGSDALGGQGNAGDSSGGAADLGQKCEPGTTYSTPYGTIASNCYSWGDTHAGIPNLRPTSLRDLKLPQATTPGTPYALSLGMGYGSTDATIELWGSDGSCGNSNELVWWGPMRSGEICAEFTPTQAHSHLLMVWRPAWKSLGAQHDTVTLCPAGSCGDHNDGKGLGAGDPLNAPRGAIQVNAGIKAGPLQFSPKVGYGYMELRGQESVTMGGPPAAVQSGYFRFHQSEGYDDAWYCPGAGSKLAWVGDKRVHLDLSAITRVANCKTASGGTGTATLTLPTVTGAAPIVSNMPEFADSGGKVWSNGCFESATKAPCTLEYTFTDGRELRLHAFQADAQRTQGTSKIHDFTDTALIVMPVGYGPAQVACAGQGTATFAADGSLTISLSQITPLGSCPGQAIADSAFSTDIQFL